MSRVYVFLADGFEEIEGLTVVDVLRRAKVDVCTVSVTGSKTIHGSHGIDLQADALFEDLTFDDASWLVLPGGMPGTLALGAHEGLKQLLLGSAARGIRISAICAAPSVLGDLGLLRGCKAACHPGFEDRLQGAEVVFDDVAEEENVITSRGMGTAIAFALTLVKRLCGRETAMEIGSGLVWNGEV
ncbi:MAG: DJ-1/PfpI family protein [Lachnospiraceae bacterium]|nr:DJ-1/PfpI family protein [Lachnospiraceae bacterium]